MKNVGSSMNLTQSITRPIKKISTKNQNLLGWDGQMLRDILTFY